MTRLIYMMILFFLTVGMTMVSGVSVDPDLDQGLPMRPQSEDSMFVFSSMQMLHGAMVRILV